jgi:hypothetical protein
MSRYTIVNTETKSIKKLLPKLGEIPVCDGNLDGVIKIKNYRKYTSRDEIDVVFEGKIFVKIVNGDKKWHDTSILEHKGYRVSKVKLNRFLRKNMLWEVKNRMNYFGVEIKDYGFINKVGWK